MQSISKVFIKNLLVVHWISLDKMWKELKIFADSTCRHTRFPASPIKLWLENYEFSELPCCLARERDFRAHLTMTTKKVLFNFLLCVIWLFKSFETSNGDTANAHNFLPWTESHELCDTPDRPAMPFICTESGLIVIIIQPAMYRTCLVEKVERFYRESQTHVCWTLQVPHAEHCPRNAPNGRLSSINISDPTD